MDRPADSLHSAAREAGALALPGSRQSVESECDSYLPGIANQCRQSRKPMCRVGQSRRSCCARLRAESAAVPGFELSAVHFPEPELFESLNASCRSGSSPSDIRKAKNFVYAYSQQANLSIERDLGHGYSLEPRLQLQRRPPPESSHQCEYHSRRLMVKNLQCGRCGLAQTCPRQSIYGQRLWSRLRSGPLRSRRLDELLPSSRN